MNLLYKLIEEAIRSHTSQLLVPQGTTQEEVYQCIHSIMRENPDIFWFSNQWRYSESDHIIHFHYTISKEDSLTAKKQIYDVVQKDFRINLVSSLPKPAKVMYVYKWIALKCHYRNTADNQTIYNVFVLRSSECVGYAKATQFLFKLLGFESKIVFGKMHNIEVENTHCWVVVLVMGAWYHIDPTFAIPPNTDLLCKAGVKLVYGAEGLAYNYFCCDTNTIKQSRIIEDENDLPRCVSNGTTYIASFHRIKLFERYENNVLLSSSAPPRESCAPYPSIQEPITTESMPHNIDSLNTYQPKFENVSLQVETPKKSFWERVFGRKEKKIVEHEIYGSVFAPAEVKCNSQLMVQVYLHLPKEAKEIEQLSQMADLHAKRRYYKPLGIKLKVGDNVNVELNIYGETLLSSTSQKICWQGKFANCSLRYFVPKELDVENLACEVNLYINGMLIGNMTFITAIVDQPRKLNSEIKSKVFKRIFISYAHQDSGRVKDFALAYKAQKVDYFFDRDKLAAGDVYEEKILEYIDSADLFILCWSKNAANSEYVNKERRRAMLRAYPQLSYNEATLKIYPISIEPKAELPEDMAGIYNFEEA